MNCHVCLLYLLLGKGRGGEEEEERLTEEKEEEEGRKQRTDWMVQEKGNREGGQEIGRTEMGISNTLMT